MKMTLDRFDERFPTEESCKLFLQSQRWPDGVKCPKCGSPKLSKLNTRPFHWLCKFCGNYRFSVISGTIFENTKKPLKLWFRVAYFMLVSKKGMSALQIHRTIFGEDATNDYHTTWYMCTRLRAAMRSKEWGQLMGVVEVDETYIGGKDRNRHKGKKSAALRKAGKAEGYAKVGVIGAIARKGNVVCPVIGEAEAPTLSSFVDRVTSQQVRLVATDENQAYNYVRRGLPHETINHSQDEMGARRGSYKQYRVFWSLLKRGRSRFLPQRQQGLSAAVPR
jgi:transposase-like protein